MIRKRQTNEQGRTTEDCRPSWDEHALGQRDIQAEEGASKPSGKPARYVNAGEEESQDSDSRELTTLE